MGVAVRAELARLKKLVASRTAASPTLALSRLRDDPARLFTDAGLVPDGWQADLLRGTHRRLLMCCSRQSGKSQVAGALALREALCRPASLVLLLAPTLRQAGELLREKVLGLFHALGRPVPGEATQLELRLGNGSRVVALPGANEAGIRVFAGVRLLVVDEAARVPDSLLAAVRPMLAVSGGAFVALSTPNGRSGWFYREWHGAAGWERVCVTARECPRISASFLAEEMAALGPRIFAAEYDCSFEEALGAIFRAEDIRAACEADVRPLFAPPAPTPPPGGGLWPDPAADLPSLFGGTPR